MMPGLLEVIEGGFGNSIQDQGRFGFRHMGIAASGFLDTYSARCANALGGNDQGAACIEIRVLGPTLRLAQGRIKVALAGNVSANLTRVDGQTIAVQPWCSVTILAGDTLKVSSIKGGTAYLAVSGGIETPSQLGSRSTYMRAMIGGVGGRLIAKGQQLPVKLLVSEPAPDLAAVPWVYGDEPIRVVAGPQDSHFKPESVERFLSSEYHATSQMDRMGARLDGPALEHLSAAHADIVSDGIAPGAIQVPANGEPIVLLADCQTVGGYPKIATVISADVPRFGQLQVGQKVRFQAVGASQARMALLEREAQWASWADRVRSVDSASQ